MSEPASNRNVAIDAGTTLASRGSLFWKYVVLVAAVVCVALPANWLFGVWFSYRDHRAALVSLQREQAAGAAAKIGQFVKEIEGQLGWMTQLPWPSVTLEERRFDALRLLRQVPAITEVALLDEAGREQLRVSRVAHDAIGSEANLSREPAYLEAMARKAYYGPVYFRRGSEPYFTLANTSSRRDAGVAVAEVNLVFVWDVVSQIKVGEQGRAYVVDAAGRLIAHPDIALVLQNTDLSGLEQVQAARAGARAGPEDAVVKDVHGKKVLAAHASVTPLGWLVFVELPLAEAYAPVYASLTATGLVLLAGLVLAVFVSFVLARKMVTPIRALQTGAAQIGTGALDHRIEIDTGDELEALGDQFNRMAAQLQESYATLERKVEERTHQLELANLAKSRFLAAASHDLRQPLHALNLFVAQLHSETDQAERGRIVARVDAAVAAMNELFNALLDISKLDAGVLAPELRDFPIAHLLKRIETTFAPAAREKGLRLRIVHSHAWVRSDFILLERIALNLVSNAIRYTDRGGIVVGCRRRGARLRVDVWDSGLGIPEDQRRSIFGEFYQLATSERERRGGLGLGLAIVERLSKLLDHPLEVTSTPGKGSRFSILLPLATARPEAVAPSISIVARVDPGRGKLVVVIDDDALVLDAVQGLLRSWGSSVVTGESAREILAKLAGDQRRPDLIISDYRLAGTKTGIEMIHDVRRAYDSAIPAFLITGDTAAERLREATASGFHLLHKPVIPMALRAMVNQHLQAAAHAHAQRQTTSI